MTTPDEAKPSLGAIVEALLFVSDGPVEVAALARAAEVRETEVETALADLAAALAGSTRGLRLLRHGGSAQLVTNPTLSPWIERLLGIGQPQKLSPAAYETLAIIAYRQPVTRATIEAIRGVSSDRALATLLARGLIAEVGRLDTAGRPVLFAPTPEFLQHLGLASLDELPPFERFAELVEREQLASAIE